MKRIQGIADYYRAKVIEDASHAFGATYPNGNKVGNCSYSEMTVFSLHPVKGITSGEGGIVTTNQKENEEKLRLFRSHGMVRDKDSFVNLSHATENGINNPWYYEAQT